MKSEKIPSTVPYFGMLLSVLLCCQVSMTGCSLCQKSLADRVKELTLTEEEELYDLLQEEYGRPVMGLALSLTTEKERYLEGQTVEMKVTVHNFNDKPIVLRGTFDFPPMQKAILFVDGYMFPLETRDPNAIEGEITITPDIGGGEVSLWKSFRIADPDLSAFDVLRAGSGIEKPTLHEAFLVCFSARPFTKTSKIIWYGTLVSNVVHFWMVPRGDE